ncbi:MAG: serine hydrolase [Gemmatimonadota bacterium]|nr:MAG: serine hydrolase [Gemmatimonadota bacterium]
MNRLTAVFAFALLACAGQEPDYEPHILAVENALQPTVVISGEPVETATLAERMERHKVPAVSIAVINGGAIEWARAYGMADVEEQRPATARTLFQAASISKPVAALAALKFVRDGALQLDQNVNDVLTSWKIPENEHTAVKPVTLRGLLTHSAGTTVSGFPGYERDDSIPSTIGVLDGEGNTVPIRVDIDPGSQWRYSGGGYTVVQQLLTDVAGKPFPQIMQETVLGPIGMRESTYEQPLPEPRWADAATAYREDGTAVEGKWHVYPEMAAAGLWTTPSDLARFAIEVQKEYAGTSETVLSADMARQMLTPDGNSWGLGPPISGDGERFSHGGSNEGFRCYFFATIDGDHGAVVMTNSDSGGELMNEILITLAKEYGWSGYEPVEKTVAAVSPGLLGEYAGRYELEELGVITLEADERGLWADVPTMGRVELLPESDTEFFSREDGTKITFRREDGRVVGFTVENAFARKLDE